MRNATPDGIMIVFLLLILESTSGDVEITIKSMYDSYTQENDEVWTLDIPSLQYNINASLDEIGISWSLNITMETQLITSYCTYSVVFVDTDSSCNVQPLNLTFCSNLTCEMTGRTAEITVDLLDLDYNDNNSVMSVDVFSSANHTIGKSDLVLQECSQVVDGFENVIVHPLGEKANYNSWGNCSCSIPNAVPYDVKSLTTDTVKAKCNAVTEWEGCQNVQCWFAPIPVLNIISNSSLDFGNDTYVVGDTIHFNCSGNPGYPKVDYFQPFFNNSVQSENLLLQPVHNDLSVKCQGVNNFTSLNDGLPAYSLPATLFVLFAPYNDSVSEIFVQEASIGSSVELAFLFSANPLLLKSNISINFTDSMQSKSEILNASTGDLKNQKQLQTYIYMIPNVTGKSFGNFTVTAISPHPYFEHEPLIMTINLKEIDVDNSKDGKGINTWLIVGCAVAGSLIVILVFVLLITCIKKRREMEKKDNNDVKATSEIAQREERINPIYGSAHGGV